VLYGSVSQPAYPAAAGRHTSVVPGLAVVLFLAHILPGLFFATQGMTARASTTPQAGQVDVVIGLKWQNQPELDQLLHDIANPQSARYGRHLTASEFDGRFGPSSETVREITDLLGSLGLRVTELSPSRLFIRATGWLENPEHTRTLLIEQLRSLTKESRVYCNMADETAGAQANAATVAGGGGSALRSPLRGPLLPAQTGSFYGPADIARAYDFQGLYAAIDPEWRRETTIAIATAFGFDWSDVEKFWQQAGIDRDRNGVELIPVGSPPREVHAETTVDVEWASAMAPRSRILVYAGEDASADAFLKVYDRIVSDNRAAVLTTSWGACEGRFGHTYLDQAHAIFQRAAVQGITVIAASGDNGAYDCGDTTPSVDFPASDPYVLAVGGTSLREDESVEQAWRGSGGGVSRKWSAPPWQMRPEANRTLPDVAFHADPARGFTATLAGRFSTFGGTSIAAPCWAALIALINDRRTAEGRPALGLAAPQLCEVAESSDRQAEALRDITTGDNRGYVAGSGWDFPTGWGTPRADALAAALSSWSPPPLAPDDVQQTTLLTPTPFSRNESARLLFSRRCARTNLRLQFRHAPAGEYRLNLDGTPVASFGVRAGAPLWLDLPGLDPRGHEVSLTADDDDQVRFAATFPPSQSPAVRLRLTMTNTGIVDAAAGTVLYQAAHGRERVSIRVRNLPPGDYTVRIGRQVLGSVTMPADRDSARITLDSSGLSGGELPISPLCESASVSHGSLPLLMISRIARGAEPCSR